MIHTLQSLFGRLRDIAQAEAQIHSLQTQPEMNLNWNQCEPCLGVANSIHGICSEWFLGVSGKTPPARHLDSPLGQVRIRETCGEDKKKRNNFSQKLSRRRNIVAAVLEQVDGDETRWVEGANAFITKYGKNVQEGLNNYKKAKHK